MCMLDRRCVCHLCEQRVKALVNIHKAAQVHLSLVSVNNLISTKLSCWPEMRFRCHIWLQRMLWWVCTFAQAQLSLCHCTNIFCVGSNDDLCPIYTSSEGSGESAPVHCKYNNGVQPSLRYFNAHFKVMKILNKTFIKKMSFHGGIMLPMLSSI